VSESIHRAELRRSPVFTCGHLPALPNSQSSSQQAANCQIVKATADHLALRPLCILCFACPGRPGARTQAGVSAGCTCVRSGPVRFVEKLG